MVLSIETLYCDRDFLYRSRASLIKYMDADIACFWLLPLDRHKNNNEVTVVNCQSYIVIDFFLFSSYKSTGVSEPTF